MIKLIKGDCLVEMDRLISEGIKVDAIITDIPYGTTNCRWDSAIPFDAMWSRLKQLRNEHTPIALFGSEPFASKLRLSNLKEYKYDWIYRKPQGVNPFMSKKQPLNDIENICIFYLKQSLYIPQKSKGKPYSIIRDKNSRIMEVNGQTMKQTETINDGDRLPKRVLDFKQERGLHPTQKPVKLMEYLIKTYTCKNDTVLDFTFGSGTTAIACINTNRNFIGIEFDDAYFDIAKQRIDKALLDKQ